MIDCYRTIDQFFADVDSYLTHCIKNSKDVVVVKNALRTRCDWRVITSCPERYINERYDYVRMLSVDGLMRAGDSSLCMAVCKVLNVIRDIYIYNRSGCVDLTEQHISALLAAYKAWKYQSSNNIFKDFIFPFRSASSFAVRVKNQKSK